MSKFNTASSVLNLMGKPSQIFLTKNVIQYSFPGLLPSLWASAHGFIKGSLFSNYAKRENLLF